MCRKVRLIRGSLMSGSLVASCLKFYLGVSRHDQQTRVGKVTAPSVLAVEPAQRSLLYWISIACGMHSLHNLLQAAQERTARRSLPRRAENAVVFQAAIGLSHVRVIQVGSVCQPGAPVETIRFNILSLNPASKSQNFTRSIRVRAYVMRPRSEGEDGILSVDPWRVGTS